ncbi:MAG: hypothetical protein Q8L85_09800 [Alphaproteobacteria bacterium]|nr:hypothetical protein [Alphaproteobacteria bacterium]
MIDQLIDLDSIERLGKRAHKGYEQEENPYKKTKTTNFNDNEEKIIEHIKDYIRSDHFNNSSSLHTIVALDDFFEAIKKRVFDVDSRKIRTMLLDILEQDTFSIESKQKACEVFVLFSIKTSMHIYVKKLFEGNTFVVDPPKINKETFHKLNEYAHKNEWKTEQWVDFTELYIKACIDKLQENQENQENTFSFIVDLFCLM